jgi:hypothetical protein
VASPVDTADLPRYLNTRALDDDDDDDDDDWGPLELIDGPYSSSRREITDYEHSDGSLV